MALRDSVRWNHNIHYHPTVLRAVPAGAQCVLDIGCGEGMLARELHRTVPHVTGIDLDEPSLELARRYQSEPDLDRPTERGPARPSDRGAFRSAGHGGAQPVERGVSPRPDEIDYVLGDFLTHPFEPESFDAVVSVATLHHVDATAGLTRMRELLRPGGVLVVIGLARETLPRDLPAALAGVVANAAYRVVKGYWQHPSPVVWPPPLTFAEMHSLSADLLPGRRYRRRLFFRYSLIWRKPPA